MKSFDVEITETLQRTITIEAESQEAAIAMVEEMRSREDPNAVLDWNDFIDDEIQVVGERELEKNISAPAAEVSFQFISSEEADKIFDTRQPLGYFVVENQGVFVGIDNSTGDAFTEEFPDLESCKAWFADPDLEPQTNMGKMPIGYDVAEPISSQAYKKVLEALNKMPDSELRIAWNQYCATNNYDHAFIYQQAECGTYNSEQDIKFAASCGKFNRSDAYWCFANPRPYPQNGDSPVSFNRLDDKNSPLDTKSMAHFIIRDDDILDSDFIRDALDSATDVLKAAMEAAGYEFDDIDSYAGNLFFLDDYGQKLPFEGWAEVESWLHGVVFDDPEVSDRVEGIMSKLDEQWQDDSGEHTEQSPDEPERPSLLKALHEKQAAIAAESKSGQHKTMSRTAAERE